MKRMTHQQMPQIVMAVVATRFFLPAITAVAALLVLTERAEGVPVYSQTTPSEPGGAFTSINTATGQKIADNFMVDGTGLYTVRSLRFIGGYGVNNPPPFTPPVDAMPPDNFRIVFLEDAVGSPGSPIPGGDFSITSTFGRTSTGAILLNGLFNPIEYVVDLGSGVSLNEGTEYWISISNAPGPDHGWAWARAFGVLDLDLASTTSDVTTGPWIVGASDGMWFELDNQNVPEPTSKTLLMVALVVPILALGRTRGPCVF